MCYYEIELSHQCLKELLGKHCLTIEDIRCTSAETKRFLQRTMLDQLKLKP